MQLLLWTICFNWRTINWRTPMWCLLVVGRIIIRMMPFCFLRVRNSGPSGCIGQSSSSDIFDNRANPLPPFLSLHLCFTFGFLKKPHPNVDVFLTYKSMTPWCETPLLTILTIKFVGASKMFADYSLSLPNVSVSSSSQKDWNWHGYKWTTSIRYSWDCWCRW